MLTAVTASIEVEQVIAAPIQAVWDDIARLETHVEWMADAERITFLSDRRNGAGTRMAVLTRVGPLRTTDLMEFVAWEPPHRMAIRHEGLVTGTGEFVLSEIDESTTRFRWSERLTFPAYLGGALGARVGARVLAAVWRRNLRRLAERFRDRAPG